MKKNKMATFGMVVCFVAAIAVVGFATFNRFSKQVPNEEMQEETKEENVTQQTEETNTNEVEAEIVTEKEPIVQSAPQEEIVQEAPAITFAADETLLWPVSGDVLLNYSMDQTIHFQTLDQYKYNPALILGAQVGEQVVSATDGIVKSIDVKPETGITMTVDVGDGYEIVYGQLKDTMVEEGTKISKGEWLGYVSEPTKYYSVEGPNLYFQVLKDSVPVNPLDYLEA